MTESVVFWKLKKISNIEINKNRKGWNVLDVPANTYIKRVGEFFKEKNLIKLPKVIIILY